jgi:hypothetical protein
MIKKPLSTIISQFCMFCHHNFRFNHQKSYDFGNFWYPQPVFCVFLAPVLRSPLLRGPFRTQKIGNDFTSKGGFLEGLKQQKWRLKQQKP